MTNIANKTVDETTPTASRLPLEGADGSEAVASQNSTGNVLKIISLLMDYPTEELTEYADSMIDALKQERSVSIGQRDELISFVEQLATENLLDAQETYVGLFDRGRRQSLLLFEHVHGESRDRGQAMVNLMKVYGDHGFDIGVKELPDYLPLFLEFLSQIDTEKAKNWLADMSHILALVGTRLAERRSNYASLFTVLLTISGTEIDIEDVKKQISGEPRDDTAEAVDKIWEEEMVKFVGDDSVNKMGGNSCSPTGAGTTLNVKKTKDTPQSMQWVDAGNNNRRVLPDL